MTFNRIRAEILCTAFMRSRFYNPKDTEYDKKINITGWILHNPGMSILEQEGIEKVLPKFEKEYLKITNEKILAKESD